MHLNRLIKIRRLLMRKRRLLVLMQKLLINKQQKLKQSLMTPKLTSMPLSQSLKLLRNLSSLLIRVLLSKLSLSPHLLLLSCWSWRLL